MPIQSWSPPPQMWEEEEGRLMDSQGLKLPRLDNLTRVRYLTRSKKSLFWEVKHLWRMPPKNSGRSSKFPGGHKVIHRTAQRAFFRVVTPRTFHPVHSPFRMKKVGVIKYNFEVLFIAASATLMN